MTDKITGLDLVSVSRASTKLEWDGTQFVSFAENTPAYRMVNGRMELSVEPEHTNVMLHAANVSDAAWGKTRAAAATASFNAPNGSPASVIAANTQNLTHIMEQKQTLLADTVYTISFFAKNAGCNAAEVVLRSDDNNYRIQAEILLNEGTFRNNIVGVTVGVSGGYYSWRRWAESYPDGWYRYCITFTTGTAQGYGVRFTLMDAYPNSTFIGNNQIGMAIWDYQCVLGTQPGSPIITTTTALTRAADVVSLSTARVPVSSGYGVRVEWTPAEFPSDGPLLSIGDGTADNQVKIAAGAQFTSSHEVVSGGVSQASASRQSLADGSPEAVAVRAATNSVAFSAGGSPTVVDETATIPATSSIIIGGDADSARLNGTIRRITIWPTLSDAQIQAVSTRTRRKINVVLSGGQSNAVGNGANTLPGFPSYFLNNRVENVLSWNGTVIKPLLLNEAGSIGNGRDWELTEPPINQSPTGGFVWEALRLYAQKRDNVVSCNVSLGATPLSAPEGFSSWNADYASVTGTYVLLEELEDRYAALVAYCTAQDIELNPVAMLWHQGEADSVAGRSEFYEANLTALINKVRGFTNSPRLPFISGTIPNTSASYSVIVRSAQFSVGATLPNVFYRDNNGLTFHDTVHFDPPSQLIFGQWCADRLLAVS